jgi:hypothetical protein
MNGPLPCPACGHYLTFRAGFPAKQVCPACRLVVHREGSGISGTRTAPAVPEDMTPLRVGTVGKYQGQSFELTGRIRYTSEQGYQNWWAMLLPDGTGAWLTEAYGDYAILRKTTSKVAPHKLTGSAPGKEFELGTGLAFYIKGLDKKKGLHLEGELPAGSGEHTGFISVELGNEKRELAVVNVYALDKIAVYLGGYVPFESFHFTKLRDLHDWL